jgi:anti-sigma factor ChrR (cupin superfamily)
MKNQADISNLALVAPGVACMVAVVAVGIACANGLENQQRHEAEASSLTAQDALTALSATALDAALTRANQGINWWSTQ